MIRLALGAFVALAALPARAEIKTHDLYLECRAGQSIPITPASDRSRAICNAFLGGFTGAYILARQHGNSLGICPPVNIDAGDMLAMLERYVKVSNDAGYNAALWQQPAYVTLHAALSQFMPCQPAAPQPANPKTRGF